MIQIFIDIVTKRIIGYNTVVPDNYRMQDGIFVEDNEMPLLASYRNGENLYFIDGQLTKETPDPDNPVLLLSDEMDKLDENIRVTKETVNNEYKYFMDNIINGLSIDEAREFAKDARNNLSGLKDRRRQLESRYKEAASIALNGKFEQEEESIDYKYFLSMVTIIRDENNYIEEWIRYHIEELGFEHFYIYDNESSIPVDDYLKNKNFKYLDRLTIIPWKTSTASQQDSHNDFLRQYSKETKWFIGADPDEYIILKDTSKSLHDFLKENHQYATIKCLWKHFNANGQIEKTAGTDMERFTQATDWENWKHGGKKFAQSNRVRGFHSYVPMVRMDAKEADYDNEITTMIQLNHYYTRSYEEWVNKMKRGSSNPKFLRKFSDFFKLNPDMEYLNTGKEYYQGYGENIEIKDQLPETRNDNFSETQ